MELVWLASQAKVHELIVELGSFLGRSTRVLADNTAGKVYAVDDWETGIKPHWGPEILEKLTPDFAENMYRGFCLHLKDHIEQWRVIPVQMNHGDKLDFLGNLKADMVFIDGDHHYEPVKRDIRNALRMMNGGGLLSGHDYDWKTVKQAVDELLPDIQIVPGTSIWFCFTQGGKDERVPEKASVA